MRGFSIGAAIAASSLFVSSALADVDPIVIKGSKFFYKTNGTQFYMRGVAYQQDYAGNGSSTSTTGGNSYTDPLADATSCQRDIPYLQQLRTNTIRVYAIDPTKDHSTCMNALAAAGIYVISDLSEPNLSINRDSPSWNTQLYSRYAAVIDSLAPYSNTLGFFAGNEVSNQFNNTAASAFVKAAVRDMKAYISAKGYRPLGVGYASDDDATIRAAESEYMACGDSSSTIDFWGYNIYEWCGDSSYSTSGYEARTNDFRNYPVPVFFAEYGCNKPSPRMFTDTPVLYGSDMAPVWSGGIVYMYFQEANNFGLVSVSGNSVSTLQDFENLSKQIATVSPSGTAMSAYTPSNSAPACPTTGASWAAAATPLPRTPDSALCQCMYDSLSCVVKSSVAASQYGTLFGSVCGLDNQACVGISTNLSITSNYGAYSMCNATQQLAYAMNQYYMDNNANPSACDFGGSASTKAATSPSGVCSTQIQAVGTGGTGSASVTPGAGATGASGNSGAASGSTSKSAAQGRIAGPVDGVWQMTTLVSVACLSAVGMIFL